MTKKELEAMVMQLQAQVAAQVPVPVQTVPTKNPSKLTPKQKVDAVCEAVRICVKEGNNRPQKVLGRKGFGELRATLIDLMLKKHQVVVSPDPVKLKKTVVTMVLAGRLISNKKLKLVTKAQNVTKERKDLGYVIGAQNAERYAQMFEMKYAPVSK
jgi:hypothetical protein